MWATELAPLLQRARDGGMKVAAHCGEVSDNHEEHKAMITFAPERLGHCLSFPACAQSGHDCLRLLLASLPPIPVEVCPTAHYRGYDVPFAANVFAPLWQHRHPLVLGTDNPPLIETDLSNEYDIFVQHTPGITIEQLLALARSAIDHVFAGEQVKRKVRASFDAQADRLKEWLDVESVK